MTGLMFTHYSGNTFMSLKKLQDDVDRLTSGAGGDRLWITLTETAEAESIQAIRSVVGKRYQIVNPDDGDITFLVHRELDVLGSGGPLVIPAQKGPASKGGHGPRHNSWVRMGYDGEDITHTGMHTVVGRVNGRMVRDDEQRQQVQAMAKQLNRQGKGKRLATGSGDLNASLPGRKDIQDILDRNHITTTAHETGTMTPTHDHSRLDYVWTRDADQRLVVKSMTVRRGPVWNSDHDPIDVWIHVR